MHFEQLKFVLSLVIVILLILMAGVFIYFDIYEPNIILLGEISHNNPDQESIINALSDFEKEMSHEYPLGNKTFCIRHPEGRDYFNFFAGLGSKFKYMVYWEDGKVWATACAVLRTIPDASQPSINNPSKAWYICDLKVHPDKRGQRIPYRMFCKGLFPAYFECSQGYGITMLSVDTSVDKKDKKDKVSTIAQKAGFDPGEVLNIYMMSAQEFDHNVSEIKKMFGSFRLESNAGKKDLFINGEKMNLYHIIPGAGTGFDNKILPKTIKRAYFMFCLPEKKCENLTFSPFARARILQYNMPEDQDWSFINTAEI